jgi:hypothetical protein
MRWPYQTVQVMKDFDRGDMAASEGVRPFDNILWIFPEKADLLFCNAQCTDLLGNVVSIKMVMLLLQAHTHLGLLDAMLHRAQAVAPPSTCFGDKEIHGIVEAHTLRHQTRALCSCMSRSLSA